MIKTTLRSVPLLALALCASAPAQQYYHPAPGWLAEVDCSDSKALLQALRGTRAARLLESEDLKPLVAKASARFRERQQRIDQLRELVKASGAEPASDYELGQEFGTAVRDKLLDSDVRNVHLWWWMSADKKEPSLVVSLATGAAEGKLLRELWQKAAKAICDKQHAARVSDPPELGGHKFEVLRPADAEEVMVWFWSHDDLHVFGVGKQVLPGSLATEPPAVPAGIARVLDQKQGVAMNIALDKALAMARPDAPGLEIWSALGLDGISALTFGLAIDGEHFRESWFAEMAKGPKGLLASWLDARAPLPAHPQVADAMLQVGFSLDLNRFDHALTDVEKALAKGEKAPKQDAFRKLVPELAKALTGGISFQVSGPGKGSVVPRLSLSAGIADHVALDALLMRARKELEGIEFDDRETEGVKWTSVKIPNNPGTMVPTFAVLGDVFVLAESPATIKAMIRAVQDKAPSAMPTEGAPAVAASGEVRPGLDVRYDVGAIWRVLQKHYLPIVQLFAGQGMMQSGIRGEPLLEQGDLPEAAVIAPHLGLGRGGLAVIDGGVLMTSASSLGDPSWAALASIMLPMLPSILGMSLDAEAGQLQGRIGEARLKKVHQALATWRASFGGGKSLPRSLGELWSRGLLDGDDALLVPGASEPQKFEYEDADGAVKKVASSFRYVPDGKLKVAKAKLRRHVDSPFADWPAADDEAKGEEVVVVLYEHKEHPRGQRMLMTADGTVYQVPEQVAAELLGGK
jgi:hypothetical protein